jgi:peroxisomal 2,4-dienoyl-CoA reductase
MTVIAPGPVADTEGYDRLSAGTPEDMQKSAQTRVPLGRYGSVSDIANASVFLFSEAANWITGQIIVRALTH